MINNNTCLHIFQLSKWTLVNNKIMYGLYCFNRCVSTWTTDYLYVEKENKIDSMKIKCVPHWPLLINFRFVLLVGPRPLMKQIHIFFSYPSTYKYYGENESQIDFSIGFVFVSFFKFNVWYCIGAFSTRSFFNNGWSPIIKQYHTLRLI